MFDLCGRRRRLTRVTRCSAQWIAMGICVLSASDTIDFRSCDAFSFPKQVPIGRSFPSILRRGKPRSFDQRATTLSLYNESKEENDDDKAPSLGLPALGPAGFSSNSDNCNAASMDGVPGAPPAATATIYDENNEKTNTVPTFVNPKFALQYTCNVCETKNRVIVSRQAYREGMVIAVCKGCQNKHWIADNLDPTLSHSNIEEYFESRGQGDTVNRVTEEVYEIERVWGLKGGEITDESGDTVLE